MRNQLKMFGNARIYIEYHLNTSVFVFWIVLNNWLCLDGLVLWFFCFFVKVVLCDAYTMAHFVHCNMIGNLHGKIMVYEVNDEVTRGR